MQLDQNPSPEMHAKLVKRLFALPSIVEGPSAISVPGARALVVEPNRPVGPPDAFLIDRELAHIHPVRDGSLHIAMPPDLVEEAMESGWAEVHPVALRGMIPMNMLMVYGPRTDDELETVMKLVEASRARAAP